MIFKPNMIVVMTNGRLAGKKAVVLKVLDDLYILVAGVNRTPVESPDYAPSWQKRKNEKFLTFIKKVNVNHVIATRYKADIGLANIAVGDAVENLEARKNVNTEANTLMKAALDANKAKWLFTPLKLFK